MPRAGLFHRTEGDLWRADWQARKSERALRKEVCALVATVVVWNAAVFLIGALFGALVL